MCRFVLLALLGAVVLSGCGDEAEAPAIEGGPEHRLALEMTSIRVTGEPAAGASFAPVELKIRVYFREDAIDSTRWGLPAEWEVERCRDETDRFDCTTVELMRTAIDDEHCPADIGPGEDCTVTLRTSGPLGGLVTIARAEWLSPVRGTKPALVQMERRDVDTLLDEWRASQ